MMLRLYLGLAMALGWAALCPVPARAGEGYAREFEVIQRQVKVARDRVMPALVRVQPIVETYRGGRKISRTGFGSGVITGPQGYVVTNYHVAGKARSCLCVMANKEEVPARLVGGDPWTDIAVIQLDLSRYSGHSLTWAALGDSDRMEEGDFVLAMGSPFALTRTVTFGIVSCRDRSLGVMGIDRYQRTGQFNTWLQIDALINPGNSGGPLVNLRGEVVGINARGGAGMGFAIPVNIVKEVVRQIREHGEVRRSYLGMRFQPMEKFKKNFLGDVSDGGVLVSHVDEGSPADAGGLRAGDVIVSLGGEAVRARFEEQIYPIAKRVADLPIGSKVAVTYVRRKRKHEASLTTEKLENVMGDERELVAWGFTVKQITRAMAREMRLPDNKGVLVTGSVSGSVAHKAGLRSGDILKELDGRPVESLGQFEKLFEAVTSSGKEKVLGQVLKGGRTPRMVLFKQEKKEKDGEKDEDVPGGPEGTKGSGGKGKEGADEF